MVEINFGASNFERYHAGGSLMSQGTPRENIIVVPEKGSLKLITGYSELYKEDIKLSESKDNDISYPIKMADIGKSKLGSDISLLLIWISQRSEWIAVFKYWWMESSIYSDEFYTGPFELDKYCTNKLLESYNIPKEKIALEKTRKTSPNELEKIASSLK